MKNKKKGSKIIAYIVVGIMIIMMVLLYSAPSLVGGF